jgi:hypothetical protein
MAKVLGFLECLKLGNEWALHEDRQADAADLKEVLECVDRGFGVEIVEDRLVKEDIDAPILERLGLQETPSIQCLSLWHGWRRGCRHGTC